MRYLQTSFLASLLFAADISAACTREELEALATSFLDSGIRKTEFTVDPNVKIVENNRIVQSLAQSSLPNITANIKPNFKLQLLDEEQCQAAVTVVVREGAALPTADNPDGAAIFSYSLKLSGPGGLPTEIDVIHHTGRTTANTTVFSPFSYPDETPAYWTTPAPGTFARQQLLDIMKSFPNSVEDKCGSCIKSAPTCRRIENGVLVDSACNGMFPDRPAIAIYARRYFVDTTLNIAMGRWIFSGGGAGGLMTHEYFSVNTDGLIQEVQANWIKAPGVPDDAWGGKTPSPAWKSSKDDEW